VGEWIRASWWFHLVAIHSANELQAAVSDFYVKFWGVRGSIPAPSPNTVRYGGNTSCLEVRCGERLLILDAGTGLRYLGNTLLGKPLDADLLLTHTHFDHICGLPFFVPLFIPGNTVRLWAGHLQPELTLQHVIREMMMAPLFPVPPEIFRADVSFNDFQAGETLNPGPGIVVRTTGLNHPNRSTGFRVEYEGKSICYLTDTEHVPGQPDQNILALIQDADIVVYDSMFTEGEYRSRIGWGHSTWEAGAALCHSAKVKTFVVFHHDPDHDDAFMDRLAADVAQASPGAVVASEGLVLRP
jgi:phosphoribosyl 1,2-cyclic phosphodiesterase